MRVFLLAFLCAVALKGVVAESENEVKRGTFPFMAFLYYSDETIMDNGVRFTRSATLISNDWLISSGDVSIAFPQKTLLARLGAINVDEKFTLNEDDEEQEREVILILRPHNYSATEWWKTDISLLKTLLPFNMTSSVAPATLIYNLDVILKNCYILVYTRRDNGTERGLVQINVQLLPPGQEYCGNYYSGIDTMICAESDKSNALSDPNFCKGNSGGPLVCNSEVLGLQTYINDCKQPHLYQAIAGWKKLITCAAEQQYLTQTCADVSVVIAKDPPSSTPEAAKLPEIIGDILSEKYTQSDLTESVDTQFNTDATKRSTTSKIDEPTLTSDLDIKTASTKVNEELREVITIKTSILIENYSHDTTSHKSTEATYTEEEAMMETTEERDRKNRIEAKHEIVHGEASLNVPSLFHYVMTSVYVLAYT